MPELKRRLRQLTAALLYYSGILWLIAARRLHGQAAVLMYHRVLPRGADTYSHDGIIVTPETFERQMRFLSRHFRLLTPDAFAHELSGPGFGRRSILVTFDDGWHDNFRNALPILRRHRVPAIVFVATAYVGTTRTFWQERLTRLLYRASRRPSPADDVLQELGEPHIESLSDAKAGALVRGVVTRLKTCEPIVWERLISRLEAVMVSRGDPIDNFGEDQFLSWSEVQTLAESDVVTVGSHAHTHTPLPALGLAGAKLELAQSRQELEAHGLPTPATCAYPNGSIDHSTIAAARATGFKLGFSTGKGRVRNGDDPLRLNRINVHDRSSATNAEFLCLILGVL